MAHQFTLRTLSVADIQPLKRLGEKTFFDTFVGTCSDEDMQRYLERNFNVAQLESELNHPGMLFYGAESGGELIGYMKLNFAEAQTELQDPSAVEIQRIYVLDSHHGTGVGQALYHQALTVAEQRQADYIWLGVWEHNQKAQRFYAKNGFVMFDQHVFMMGDEAQTDIMMKKILK